MFALKGKKAKFNEETVLCKECFTPENVNKVHTIEPKSEFIDIGNMAFRADKCVSCGKNNCDFCEGEGYVIGEELEGGHIIQRCDHCKKFDSDMKAAEFYVKKFDSSIRGILCRLPEE